MTLETDPHDVLARTDAASLWEALAQDTPFSFVVIDRSGTVLFMNRVAMDLLGMEDVAGRPLAELVGERFAAERISFIEKAISTHRPVHVMSMVRGVLQYVTYRPARAHPENGAALLVGFPAELAATDPRLKPEGELILARHNDLGPLGALTEREFELLHHIGMGLSSEEAAHRMHRSTRTVEWHRASLGQKLGCDNRVQLARIAIRCGLTAVDIPYLVDLHRDARRGYTRGV
jgi:PAS domain S-box-containing protein